MSIFLKIGSMYAWNKRCTGPSKKVKLHTIKAITIDRSVLRKLLYCALCLKVHKFWGMSCYSDEFDTFDLT